MSRLLSLMVLAVFSFSVIAEDAQPGQGGQGGQNQGGRGGRRGGGQQGGGQPGQGGQGQGQPGQGGGGFGGGNFGGGQGGIQNLLGMLGGGGGFGGMNMMARGLGIESTVKLDQLPYGAAKSFVLRVPVGGVDNLDERNGNGWKAEEIFKLSEEQTKSIDGLRTEYKAELEKLQKEFDESQKTLAEKVKELRTKYEGKANEVIAGDPKTEKEKLDVLGKEHGEKIAANGKEQQVKLDAAMGEIEKAIEEARKNNDWNSLRDIGRKNGDLYTGSRQAVDAINKETETKMKEAVTGDTKSKLEEAFKKNSGRNAWGRGGRDAGGGGGGGRGGTEPPAPPKQPDNF